MELAEAWSAGPKRRWNVERGTPGGELREQSMPSLKVGLRKVGIRRALAQ